MSSGRLNHFRWLFLVPIAALYVWSMPRAVQGLDSGEMVASAVRLTVAHPPGYPLYTWWHHLILPIIPGVSAYHRAAVCTAAYMVCAMALLLRLAGGWLSAAILACLATAPVIWLYAVTPDVFALHLMLSAALIALAFGPRGPRRTMLTGLVFGFAAANHHTIVFLAPLVALVIWEERRNAVRVAALASGALVSFLAYASILWMDTGALNSWRHIQSAGDVVHHFLRRDYGTFRLSGRENGGSLLETLTIFLRTLNFFGGLALTVVVANIALTWRRLEERRAWWTLLACLGGYVFLFLPQSTVRDSGVGAKVVERFCLFPMVLLAGLALSAIDEVMRFVRPRLQTALLCPLFVAAALQVWRSDVPGLRHDTVIEDYAHNLLTVALEPNAPSMLVLFSDTQLSAARYIQAVDSRFDSVAVVNHNLVFEKETSAKLHRLLPNLRDPTNERRAAPLKIFADFLVPNVGLYAITHITPGITRGARTVIYPAGRRLVPGSGVVCAENPSPLVVHGPRYRRDSGGFVETKQLFVTYADYPLERSRERLAAGDRDGARKVLANALEWIPFCMPCKRQLCALEMSSDANERCLSELAELEATEIDYMRTLGYQ